MTKASFGDFWRARVVADGGAAPELGVPRRPLRIVVLGILALVFALVALTIHFAVGRTLAHEFAELERADAVRNTVRVRNAFDDLLGKVGTALEDWSYWDDTYAAVHEGTAEAYAEANLDGDSLGVLGVDLVALLRLDQSVVLATRIDAESGEAVRIDEPELHRLTGAPQGDPTALRVGLADCDGGLRIVGICPVFPSDRAGEPGGFLLMSRAVDGSTTDELSQHTQLTVEIAAPTAAFAGDADGVMLEETSGTRIAGSVALRDPRGVEVAVLRAVMPRDIRRSGAQATRLVMVSLGATGTALLIALGILLDRFVVRRVVRLTQEVVRIGDDAQGRIDVLSGADEIAVLGEAMNAMLDALDDARTRAEAASRAKGIFVANTSHELRSPLTAILGFAELLADDSLPDDERRSAVATIRRNGEHLLAVLNDVLDFSKIEAGQMLVERLACDPRELVADVGELLRQRAERKGLSLRIDVTPDVPRRIVSDPVRLRQILVNLVGNAIKFTERGGVRVTGVRGFSAERGAEVLRFTVADTGPGIPASSMEQLFGAFNQLDASTSRRHGGTGLGLAISRQLARLLGGELAAASRHGEGSTFTLEIPLEETDEPAVEAGAGAPPTTGTEEDAAGVRARVLVVDDGPDTLRLVVHFVRRAGAEADSAVNGRDAVRRILDAERAGRPYALVLMDMQMPELDGYEAAALLRREGCQVPIVALTAHAMSEDRERCLAAGCDDYLTKPVAAATIREAVGRWAGARRGGTSLGRIMPG